MLGVHSMHTREKVSIAPHHCLASCGSPHATHTTTHSLVGCMMGLGVPPPLISVCCGSVLKVGFLDFPMALNNTYISSVLK